MSIENMTILEQLIEHEGIRLKPYPCTSGKLTIGIGRNLEDKGITDNEAHYLLQNDIKECRYDLCNLFISFPLLDERVQRVLIDMRLNLGYSGFRGFKKMISAVRKKDWHRVVKEMKDSKWYHEVGIRSKNLCDLMSKVAEESKCENE
jgi:lysozyme